MQPLDKLEMIIKGTIKQKRKERDRCRHFANDPYGPNPLYVLGLDHETSTLEWVWTEIDAIRRNAPSMSDEIVTKMYHS